MGNDYYNCHCCNNIISSYGGYEECNICTNIICVDCVTKYRRDKRYKKYIFDDEDGENIKNIFCCNSCKDEYLKDLDFLKKPKKEQRQILDSQKKEKMKQDNIRHSLDKQQEYLKDIIQMYHNSEMSNTIKILAIVSCIYDEEKNIINNQNLD